MNIKIFGTPEHAIQWVVAMGVISIIAIIGSELITAKTIGDPHSINYPLIIFQIVYVVGMCLLCAVIAGVL